MSLSKLQEMAKNREAWHAAVHTVTESDVTQLQNNYHLAAAAAMSLQLCPTLFDPIEYNPVDGSPPGSPVPGILQARTLEWVAISFSRGSS